MNTVLPNGWEVNHVFSYESLGEDHPAAIQSNYSKTRRVSIMYCSSFDSAKKSSDSTTVAIFLLKPKP